MTEKSHGYVWELSVAMEVRSKVEHRFGWDPTQQAFVIECGSAEERLHLPVELAEAFLLKCCEKDFNERFLVDWSRAEQECIEVGDASLFIYRGKVLPSCTNRKPKLLLRAQERADSKSVSLVHELRLALSRAMKSLSAEEIHSHLYPQAAAA